MQNIVIVAEVAINFRREIAKSWALHAVIQRKNRKRLMMMMMCAAYLEVATHTLSDYKKYVHPSPYHLSTTVR